jgi:cell division protein ZapA (FtsZ GTPase activity inhibitor)
VTESRDANEAAWYDITIAGKQFNISSRHGEAHIRNVERFLDATMEQIGSRLQNRSVVNVALLTALNLADQLLLAQSEEASANQDGTQRLEMIVQRLTDALDKPPPSGDIAS